MEEGWTNATDPKEKRRIQNRVAQRAHREKLKLRIRQLEEQLENVASVTTQNDLSKQLSSYDDTILSFAIPEILPTMNSGPVSDRLRPSSSDISFTGNHATRSLLGSESSVESTLNAIQQTSIPAQVDPLARIPVEAQSMDLEWLLTESGAFKSVLERTQVHSPSMEGNENSDNSHSPPVTSLPRPLGSSDHVRSGHDSSQSAHKITIASMVQSTGPKPLLGSAGTALERLSLLVECGKRLGFSNLDEALSVYYTSDLSKSAILSHEQSLGRVRQLPNFLSSIREHSKNWPSWERTSYVRETLRSAEDIYTEECRLARRNLRDQGIAGLIQKDSQIDQMFQITRVLQQEIPNTWALITSIILHTIEPGESQQPQTILMVMVLLCYRNQDPVTTLDLCQKYLY